MYGRRERLVPCIQSTHWRDSLDFLCPCCNMYRTDSHSGKETSAVHRHAATDTCSSVPLLLKKFKLVLKSTQIFFRLVLSLYHTYDHL